MSNQTTTTNVDSAKSVETVVSKLINPSVTICESLLAYPRIVLTFPGGKTDSLAFGFNRKNPKDAEEKGFATGLQKSDGSFGYLKKDDAIIAELEKFDFSKLNSHLITTAIAKNSSKLNYSLETGESLVTFLTLHIKKACGEDVSVKCADKGTNRTSSTKFEIGDFELEMNDFQFKLKNIGLDYDKTMSNFICETTSAYNADLQNSQPKMLRAALKSFKKENKELADNMENNRNICKGIEMLQEMNIEISQVQLDAVNVAKSKLEKQQIEFDERLEEIGTIKKEIDVAEYNRRETAKHNKQTEEFPRYKREYDAIKKAVKKLLTAKEDLDGLLISYRPEKITSDK